MPDGPRRHSLYVEAKFCFDRCEGNEFELACFRKEKPVKGDLRSDRNTIITALKAAPLKDRQHPPHYVQFRHLVNDTAIPGLKFNFRKLELQCDWKGLMTALLSEEEVVVRRMEKYVSHISHIALP